MINRTVGTSGEKQAENVDGGFLKIGEYIMFWWWVAGCVGLILIFGILDIFPEDDFSVYDDYK